MDIFPLTTTSVSVLTVLMPFTDIAKAAASANVSYADILETVLFAVINKDPANTVTVIFETSEDGVTPDTALIWTYNIGPGQQCSLEIGPKFIRKFFAITAHTQSPGFPTASVQWTARGLMAWAGFFER